MLRKLLRRPGGGSPATEAMWPPPAAIYVGTNRLLVGVRPGGIKMAFFTEADDRLLTPWLALIGTHEPAVTAFLQRTIRPDDHCLDLGANFGWFACVMARASGTGPVIAVEPDAHLAGLCRDNSCLNGVHDQIEIVCGAVAEQAGPVTLHRREYRSGNTSIIPVDHAFSTFLNEPAAEPFVVPGHSIDDLVRQFGGRVDVIKIDIEGAEPRALAGAAGTIASNPQLRIVMEWSPGQIVAAGTAIADMIELLEKLRLRCARLHRGREVPITLSDLAGLPYQSAVVLRPTTVL